MLSSDYGKVLENSERVSWKLTDVVPNDAKLDFTKPFMPAAMFAGASLEFLSGDEKRKLNHILAHAYVYLFHFVEVYIVDLASRRATSSLDAGSEAAKRALFRFADEEVKHQTMFLRFLQMFDKGFGSKCEVVPDPKAVAGFILGKSPMGALLVTLHLEIITQAHYTDAVRDAGDIDPLFKNMLKYHWMEEAQHAKLDALEIAGLRKGATDAEVAQTVQDYFDIAGAFAGLLAQQAKNDVVSLERALGKTFSEDQRRAIEDAQRKTYNRGFLWAGVTNPTFLEFLGEHFPAAMPGAKQAAEAFA